MFLCLICACANDAYSEDLQPDEPKPKENNETSESEFYFCERAHWLDEAYCQLNYGVESTANVINGWFLDSDQIENITSTRGRIRFGWEPRSGALDQFDFRFKIRAKLPGLKNRFELLLSDEEDTINQQEIRAAQTREQTVADQPVIALQFRKSKEDPMSYRLGVGRGGQVYTRARYNADISLSDETKFFYYAEANYYSGDKFGAEIDGILSSQLSERSAFEITNSFQYRHNRRDWFWRHEMRYLLVYRNEKSYLLSARIDGLSEPNYRTESMLISARYKQKILRDWLYLELEPFVLWLRREDFRTSVGVALRLEVHFAT